MAAISAVEQIWMEPTPLICCSLPASSDVPIRIGQSTQAEVFSRKKSDSIRPLEGFLGTAAGTIIRPNRVP